MSEPTTQIVSKSGSGGVETLSELLCCYICADQLRDASLCPHCSKIGCYLCIKRWVTNNRANCPHCRAPLTESNLIRVPLFNEVRNELDKMPTNTLGGNKKFKERMCPNHKEKVSVYCETCHLCICHECCLWESSPHRGHKYVKIEVLLQKQTKRCEVELRKLRERMKSVLTQVQFVERKMESVKSTKMKIRREMKEAFNKMSERLDTQYEEKQHQLGEVRQKLKAQAMQITRATREMEANITNGSITHLLSESGELREDVLTKLSELQSLQPEPIPSIGELVNEMVPSYSTCIFKIHPYMYLKQKGEEVYSKPLYTCGNVWKLKVYPNGHHEDTGVYLSVFLELTEGYNKEKAITYQYCIEMLYNCSNKYPSRNYKKEYVSDFADGESWGYRRFYELSKLESDGYLREDTVVLRFSVRARTYHQRCRDLSAHTRRLEQKMEVLQKDLKAAKSAKSLLPTPSDATPSTSPQQARHHHSHSEPAPSSPHSSRQLEETHNLRELNGMNEHEQRWRQNARQHEDRQRAQDRKREGVRRRDRERTYREQVAMSQQPMRHHPQHLPGGSPVKRYLSQHQHSDSHLVGMEPAYHSQRRSSGEEHRSHRRRSADPALLQHFEGPISPSVYRHHLAPPRGATQPQERLHFRHDSAGSGTEGEEFGSQLSLGPSSSRRTSAERPPQFEEVGDDDGGCSQPHSWGEPISHSDIQISISGSTLTAKTQPRPQHHTHLHHHRAHSQEQFIDDDEGRFLGLDHMLGGPHSSQLPYFEDSGHTAPMSLALSQPTMPSKRRLQTSVPDLHILTGTSASNLVPSQGLSQSVLDMSRQSHRSEYMGGFRYSEATIPRITVSSRAMSQSYHNHLNRMASDPYLNEGVQHPGLARTVLARLKEEPELSPATHRQQRSLTTSAALQPKKCYRKSRKSGSVNPSPQPRNATEAQPETDGSNPTRSDSSTIHEPHTSGSNSELTPTNSQPHKSTSSPPSDASTSAAMMTAPGLAERSSSNTSLSHLNML